MTTDEKFRALVKLWSLNTSDLKANERKWCEAHGLIAGGEVNSARVDRTIAVLDQLADPKRAVDAKIILGIVLDLHALSLSPDELARRLRGDEASEEE